MNAVRVAGHKRISKPKGYTMSRSVRFKLGAVAAAVVAGAASLVASQPASAGAAGTGYFNPVQFAANQNSHSYYRTLQFYGPDCDGAGYTATLGPDTKLSAINNLWQHGCDSFTVTSSRTGRTFYYVCVGYANMNSETNDAVAKVRTYNSTAC